MKVHVAPPHITSLDTAARLLSEAHRTAKGPAQPLPVWRSLGDMPKWLDQAKSYCVDPEPDLANAADWLLDHDFKVRRAIRQVRNDMPEAFYRRLICLESAPDSGLPRVFSIAHSMLDASHLQLSLGAAVSYVRAYQKETSLTIAELWALPAMLRLACLEILVGAFARLVPTLKPPFEISSSARALETYEPGECISRAIANLDAIDSIRWQDFFVQSSQVEAALAADPGDVYRHMDFDTRDRYRKVIEDFAEGSGQSELWVAEQVVLLSQKAGVDPQQSHVGYWLVGEGREAAERHIGYRVALPEVVRRFLKAHNRGLYAGALVLAGLAALAVPLLYLVFQNTGVWSWITGGLLVFVPASVLAIAIVHWVVPVLVPPHVLSKLDFKEGIPSDCATAIVVPVILGCANDVPALTERMEMHWLANPDPALRLVLLSDFHDGAEERLTGDADIEQALIEGVRQLNTRYGRNGKAEKGPFILLHRARQFNKKEDCWMGWERKRGKLEQFNQFVLGGTLDAFPVREGDCAGLAGLRFVITVDADTSLPLGSVSRLVGTLAHPLNTARFDAETGRVYAGYTLLQPRVEILPEGGGYSAFSRFYAGDGAIDIYSRAVSDVYQDLFGAGIFVGKGIYEVSTFQRSLEGRVPQNALVSHDLFEGIHGRAALATDIVLYENFPANYVEYSRRGHRWIRGDWQLLPWLLGNVPVADGGREKNILSGLDRWKIIDNLRRSLVSLSLLLLVVVGWLVLPGSAWVWTLLTIGVPGAHLAVDLVGGLARTYRGGTVRNTIRQFAGQCGRWFLAIAFLVNDSLVSADAIVRTLWRLGISRHRMLEWTSAAQMTARLSKGNLRATSWRHMWPASVLSAVILGLVAVFRPEALAPALPLLALWLIAPEIAVWTGRANPHVREELNESQRAFLTQFARRTWLYFEQFAGPEDNWLPPDNYQEGPNEAIAHRTSPTNIGMMVTSSLTAWDFGFISSTELCVRTRDVLDTMDRLEKYRGHLLNWYDTRNLLPLEPRYVSVVDSGNLAVCLLALRQGCFDVACAPVLRRQMWEGLSGTLDLLVAAISGMQGPQNTSVLSAIEALAARIFKGRDRPEEWHVLLKALAIKDWPDIQKMVNQAVVDADALSAETLGEIHIWLDRVGHHLISMQRDIDRQMPWLELLGSPPQDCADFARDLSGMLVPEMTLEEGDDKCAAALELVSEALDGLPSGDVAVGWLSELRALITRGTEAQRELQTQLINLAGRLEHFAFGMDFKWLYDRETRLFHIGYNISSDRLDDNHYDLLATEARLASYFAIAKRDVPAEHWFHLGRPVTRVAGEPSILSWNGSMFEYLMPPLLLASSRNKLLGQSEWSAVEVQRRYAHDLGVPWGISESAFATTDAEGNYQYRAFGVPGLGFRRGLSRDLVIAPYASALALCVRPVAAVENLHRIEKLGATGQYGFIEAMDYTPERVPAGKDFTPVRSYMAHHQGMILAAIGNALHDDILVQRFAANQRMRVVELLLQERIPWDAPLEKGREDEAREPELMPSHVKPLDGWMPVPASVVPQTHLLGNGNLALWASEAGGGGLRWKQYALTRWQPDTTRGADGLWIYVCDVEDGAIWSVGRQPTGVVGDEARVIFHQHMVEMRRREHGISIRMETCIAPGDDVEIRRVSVVNESDRPRVLDLTSCAELVLAPALEDERHPAFAKLFVGSSILPDLDGLLFERRARNPGDQPPVLLHRLVSDDQGLEISGFETDRAEFVGRHRDMRRPKGIVEGLSRATGFTLDPMMALQVQLRLEPGETRQFAYLTAVDSSRDGVLQMAERYATFGALDWAFRNAGQEAARKVKKLGLKSENLPELQALGSLLVQPHPALRGGAEEIAANRLGQPELWSFGISGDLPILLLRLDDMHETGLLKMLIGALQLWREGGLRVDLVVLRGGTSSYEEPVRGRLLSLLREANAEHLLGQDGGVHLLFADKMRVEGRRLLEAVAWVVLDETRGTLTQNLEKTFEQRAPLPRFDPETAGFPDRTEPLERPQNLLFDNGFGGFSEDGREYIIHLEPGAHTPAPWCNVLANDRFGSIVSEAGGGFSWGLNSGEHRLTPWSNDPVTDEAGEVLYLRDEVTAEVWTPTPAPLGGDASCQVRHGAGYTSWHQRSHGLEQELLAFVPTDDPVKIMRLRLRNLTSRGRRVTATYYAEWLMGAMGSTSKPHIVTEYDADHQALLARNPWNPEFADHVAFLTADHPMHSMTADRYDFLGREGDVRHPAGLRQWGLGGRVTPGGDACAAYQVHLNIAAGDSIEVIFVLGEGSDRAETETLIRRWKEPGKAEKAFAGVQTFWDKQLSAIEVSTPDPAFDLMVNRWLLYQTLSSRVMARAGFYQAGGAFGFRDQLQDVLALIPSDPARVRAQILNAAAHQFEEGDALHWWHPPAGRGVRTHCSDDFLWLPYVTSRYVEATGDDAILDEMVSFLTAPLLRPDEGDRYALFDASAPGTLFEHCVRAIEHARTSGPHGLPLIGDGDWNDGMNRVGERGQGESVWLAWFEIATIKRFAGVAAKAGRGDLADRWRRRATGLRKAIDNSAWDGKWYVRAFDDDGLPWGSHTSDECRIDSIAQSWSVLSGLPITERTKTAMKSAGRELVRPDDRVVLLLDPPFHQTLRDPGYIKAYPPGIRENGGQYTHAATWLGLAYAGLGDGDAAWQIFDIINPVTHTGTKAGAQRYMREPYVVAGDVGSIGVHAGRGGWSWYTGAAGWTWQLGVEGILGLRLMDGRLHINPCLPKNWGQVEAKVRGQNGGVLSIRIEDPDHIGQGKIVVKVAGKISRRAEVAFPAANRVRQVVVRIQKS